MPRRPPNVLSIAGLLAVAGALIPVRGGPPAPAAAVVGTPAFLTADSRPPLAPEPVDPFPIRRVLVPADKLPAPAAGGLRRLPRDEFEALVRRAATAAAAADSGPRLVEARYRAALTDTGLAGSGEWKLANPGGTPGPVPLDPLRVAVWNPRWPDGRPALLYRPAAGTQPPTALWADGPAGKPVAFDWSARGVEEPGDLRFDLRLPPAPVAVLDLDLPAGRVPVPAQADVLVTGPTPTADPNGAGWRVAFGGQSRVEITVRGPGGAGQLPPLAAAARTARFEFAPGQAEARFEFDLDAARGPADAWEFAVDPPLRVLDAAANGREGWRVVPAAEPGQPARLEVRLREPAAGGRVVVTAVAPFPADGQPWPLPGVRPVGAVAGEEAVELRFGPDLRLDGWDPGDFRPTQAGAAPDRGYAVALKGTLAAAEAPTRRPPAVRARPAGPEFAAAGDVEWRVDPARSRLTGRFRVRVLRGPLARIPFRLPAGLVPEPAAAIPDDPAATAGPGPGGTWVVEPSRPLAADQTVEVRLSLRGPPGPPPADPAGVAPVGRTVVPFPKLAPVTPAREGTFTAVVAPAYRAWPTPAAAGQDGESGTAFAYRYAGREPDGTLTLAPRRPGVAVDGVTAVALDAGRLTAVTRLRPRADGGAIASLTVFAPDPPRGGWEWSVTADGAAVRPHPAGPLLPWLPAFAAAPPVGPAGRLWQVSLPRPAGGGIEIVVRASRPLAADATSAAVPVPVVLGADQPDLPVTLDPSAARFERAGGPSAPALVRTVGLRPRGAAPAADPGHGWRFAGLTLTTRVTEAGSVVGVFAGRVVAAGGGAVPVELPAGAAVEAATVGGRWADVTPDPPRVWLPVPAPGAGGVPFELRYRLPAAPGPLVSRLDSPAPGLPGEPGAVRRAWVAGPRYRLWPALAAAGDSDTGAVRVIDARVPAAAGFAAAAVFAGWAVAWLVGGRPRALAWAVLVGLAAGLGAAALAAPDGWGRAVRPPLVAALLAVVAGTIRRGRAADPGRPPALVPLAAAGLLLAWAGAASVAQAPGPAVVYVVPGPAGAAPSVFAPQAILDRLAGLAAPPLPPVVLASAEYDGRDADGAAVFDARFAVHCATDGEHALTLPLTGVRLEAVRLDGAAAFPDASRPDGITVPVRGKGWHTLTARFAVPVAATGADREVRFGVPDLPAGRVTFAGGKAARQLTVPARRGDLTATAGPGGPTVRADLGGGRVLTVRWRAGGPAAGRQVVHVTEGCVWDVGEGEAGATAAFVYRVEQGSLARLRFDLPPGLEPGRVAVRPLDAAAAGATNGVKSWALEPAADGWQALTVVLQTPVEGRAAVSFRLHPRRPPAGRPALLFPRAAEVATADGYYGVRLAGVTADAWEKAGVIDFPAAALAQEFAGVPELELEKRPLARAFRREGTAPPQVRPALRPPADPRPVAHEVAWHLGPRAEAEGTARWAKDASLSRVEFDVPAGVAVADVRAAELAGWSRSGPRVQVWLRAAVREPAVRWSGALAGYPVAPGKPPPEPAAVDLPFPPGAGDGVSARVRPAEGWVVAAAGKPAAGGELAFTPAANAPPPRVLVYPPPPGRPVRVWETVEPANGAVAWRAAVEVGRPPNRPLAFTLRVGELPAGADAKLELPPGLVAADAAAGEGTKAWAVTVPAESPAPARLAVTVRLPAGPVVPLPTVEVLFGGVPSDRVTRWLAADSRLRPVSRVGLWEATPGGWPDEVERLRRSGGAVWQVAGDGPLRLAAAPAEPATRPPGATPAGEPAAGPAPAADGWFDPDAGRWLAAAGWVLGFGFVGGLIARGPRRLWPELLLLLGLVSAAAAGPWFLAVSAAGVLARLGWAARKLGRVVLR